MDLSYTYNDEHDEATARNAEIVAATLNRILGWDLPESPYAVREFVPGEGDEWRFTVIQTKGPDAFQHNLTRSYTFDAIWYLLDEIRRNNLAPIF